MAWFKVDDGFYTSAKILVIPREIRHDAIGAWIICGTWSADKMTDGIVPKYVLSELGVSSSAIQALTEAGLWIDENEAIRFHDWCEYQPTKADLQAKHEAKVAAGSLGGKRSGEARRSKAEANAKQQSSKAEANANPEPEPEPKETNMYSEAAQSFHYSKDFEAFWQTYPRKQQKGDAYKAWERLRKNKQLPSLDVLTVAAENYASRISDPKFTKLPAGWLRAEMWLDEPVAAKRPVDPDAWMNNQSRIRPERMNLDS